MTNVYLLVNYNHEGSNIRGVYDSREKADAACATYNATESAAYCADSSGDKRTEQERFFVWWYSVEVVEWEMNTMKGYAS